VLQPGLVNAAVQQRLWDKGATQGSYRIGFLLAGAETLPPREAARADFVVVGESLSHLDALGNRLAALLQRVLSASGQDFLACCQQALQRLSDQDTVVALLGAQSGYFRHVRLRAEPCPDVGTILADADAAATQEAEARALLALLPALRPEVAAAYALARLDEAIVTPLFAHSSASGSLMRRKIEPLIRPVLDQLDALRRPRHG
jgi:hypothetical protein